VDIVMTTGGTAAGPVDHLHTAVGRLGGEFLVDSVAVRPGHPMALARIGATWLLALPGNPQSAIVALLSLGQPLIGALLGRPSLDLPLVELGEAATAPDGEHRLLAARLIGGRALPVRHLGSAMLRGLAAADGFAVLPPGGAADGDRVEWLGLP
jgi:molybdopterin molybdotransferase